MPDPNDPPRPSRLIVPGEAEPPAERPRLIVPDDAREDEPDEPAGGPGASPGIILPPGVAREEREGLPEYPRLRPLVLMPFSDGKRELVLVSDPMGVLPNQPVLSIESLPLLQLLDGTLSLADLTTALMRESKDLRVANMVRDFVGQLDDLLLLDSPRFHAALDALRAAYHPLEIRPAALEGRSYPADAAELRAMLDQNFAAAAQLRDAAGDPQAAADARPRALLAPHLDPRRSGPAIARAYLEIGEAPTEPLRIVILGTGHSLLGESFALTRKQFETPLGKARCDTEFVDRVAARVGEAAYRGELAHRDEHSIEFQVLYLQHRLGTRRFTIVPILCGGFHALLDEQRTPREDPEFESLIDGVRSAARELGGTTVYVAGVDFSHIGPRFGDPPIDARVKQETEAIDRSALDAAARGDADAWFRTIAEIDDATRICGFAPTYALLRCVEVTDGRLLRYEQSDEPDGSTVTIASMAWG